MGYGRALLQRDVRREEASLRKKAKKKGLWGSIGRTLGSLGAMAISAGTLNPVTLGLLSGAGSFLGGAALSSTLGGGKLTGGKFFKEDRADLQRELGAFGSKNIVESLRGGVTAGIGQATKLYAAGTKAAEAGKTAEEVSKIRKGVSFGESFKDSFVGRAFKPTVEKAILSPTTISQTTQDLSRSGEFIPSAKDLSGFGDPALEHQLQLESLKSAGKKLPPDIPSSFPEGGSMQDYFTGGKNLKGAANKAWMESLGGSVSGADALSPFGTTKPVIGTGDDIMGAALEGWNEPYGIKDVSGVGTGEGIDVDRFSTQKTRSGFMKELELGRVLDAEDISPFGLSSTARGYDYKAASARKSEELFSGLRSSIGRR